ncbi:hypothetical protein H0X48_01970 [Candidatus Dependentiae bacterium]|nr:hypothetical protein [Candidatus Dependentiae bacterium]
MIRSSLFVLFLCFSVGEIKTEECNSLDTKLLTEQSIEVVKDHDSTSLDAELDDIFNPSKDDGLPMPDFTPPSRLTIFVREYGILALDYSITAFNKCCTFKRWVTAQCCKKLLALKKLGYQK